MTRGKRWFLRIALVLVVAYWCWVAAAHAGVYQWGNDGASMSLTPSLLASGEPTALVASNASAYWITGGVEYAVGANSDGQLGDGSLTESEAPVVVLLPAGVEPVALGETEGSGVTVLANGKVLAEGANIDGALCGKAKDVETPTYIAALEPYDIVAAAGGEGQMHYLQANGHVLSCGENGEGELGDGSIGGTSKTPVEVVGLSGVVQITSGEKQACARTTGGAVYCWGGNALGQVGDGATTDTGTPQLVIAEGATQVSAGGNLASNGHTLAVLDGEVLAWGDNEDGQYGDGNTTSYLSPHPAALHFERVAAGGEASLFGEAGLVYAAGSRKSGQLADGSQRGFSDTPELVEGVTATLLSATARDALVGG